MAKAFASDAYAQLGGTAIQVFGGIGFTWEHDIHLYYKRLLSLSVVASATPPTTSPSSPTSPSTDPLPPADAALVRHQIATFDAVVRRETLHQSARRRRSGKGGTNGRPRRRCGVVHRPARR